MHKDLAETVQCSCDKMPGPSRPPSISLVNQAEAHLAQDSEDRGIHPLERHTRHLIRASLKITSLSDLVVQLLRNAVHKGKAKRVKITVNPSEWRVECEDNGALGFSNETLESLRLTIAEIYAPLKHGEHDERSARKHSDGTLCSAAALGKVEIRTGPTSSPLSKPSSLSTLMLSSSGVTQLYDRTDTEIDATTSLIAGSHAFRATSQVIVRDLFHNLPVRRSAAAAPHSSSTATHGTVESSTQRRLMLAHIRDQVKLWSTAMPSVTIELYEEDKVASSSGLGFLAAGGRRRLFKLNACDAHLKRFTDYLDNPFSSGATAVEIRVKHREFSIQACLIVDTSLHRSQRFVFANGAPVGQDATLGEIIADMAVQRQSKRAHSDGFTDGRHNDLSTRMPASTSELPLIDCAHRCFMEVMRRTELSTSLSASQTAEASEARQAKRRGMTDSNGPKPRVGHKSSPLHYFINFDITADAMSAHAKKGKAEDLTRTVETALKAGLEDALKEAGISIIDSQKTSGGTSNDPSNAPPSGEKRKTDVARKTSSTHVKRRRIGDAVVRATKEKGEPYPSVAAPQEEDESEDEEEVLATEAPHAKWRDPTNGQIYLIDSRTGNRINLSLYSAAHDEVGDQAPEDDQPARMVTRKADSMLLSRRLQSAGQTSASSATPPEWLSRTLSTWKNPVFADPDAAGGDAGTTGIPQLSQIGLDTSSSPQKRGWDTRRENAAPLPGVQLASRFFAGAGEAHHEEGHSCQDHSNTRTLAAGLHSGPRHQGANIPFSRQDMKEAEVIAQVDRKFISCLLPTRHGNGGEGHTLAFIDQHAADGELRVTQSQQGE